MKEREKMTLEVYEYFNYDNTSTIKNISMRWIKRHQEKSLIMTRVGHIFSPKCIGDSSLVVSIFPPKYIGWLVFGCKCNPLQSSLVIFLVLLNSSCWDLFYSTGDVVIKASMCLQYHYIEERGERKERKKENQSIQLIL
jgi:hypothetical protein